MTHGLAVDAEYDPNPAYSYAYDVQDSLTGDSKRQQESRSGDVVRGSYSVNDPDGTRRTVDYAADPVNGFNAVVRREPLSALRLVATPTGRIATTAVVPTLATPVAASVATPITTLASPLATSSLGLSSTSSSRVDVPSGLTVARLLSTGSPFVSVASLQQVQHLPQLQQLQLQQTHQLVNPVAQATNLGLANLVGHTVLQTAPGLY